MLKNVEMVEEVIIVVDLEFKRLCKVVSRMWVKLFFFVKEVDKLKLRFKEICLVKC